MRNDTRILLSGVLTLLFTMLCMSGGTGAAAASRGPAKTTLSESQRTAASSAVARQQVVTSTVVLGPGSITEITEQCPPTMRATSGGESNNSVGGITLVGTFPNAIGSEWLVMVRNDSAISAQIQAYAVCFAGLSNYNLVSYETSVNPGEGKFAQSFCPSGQQVLGGGGVSSSWTVNVEESAAEYSSWAFTIYNYGPTAVTSTVEAVCGSGIVNYQRVNNPEKILEPGQSGMQSLDCPAGTVVVGGGGFGPRITDSFPVTNQTWRINVKNDDTQYQGGFAVQMYCGA
ncbi:hypothetical protein [Fodinicola feengrottensis]|uniref:CUB domain-containing protein n=1 Tax=Fodinicola feengrottensis TaxID=435914 RepID=A0ABN2GL66_9ACTN|nr:hypothetical protein [Fodinicola feengrottensis]